MFFFLIRHPVTISDMWQYEIFRTLCMCFPCRHWKHRCCTFILISPVMSPHWLIWWDTLSHSPPTTDACLRQHFSPSCLCVLNIMRVKKLPFTKINNHLTSLCALKLYNIINLQPHLQELGTLCCPGVCPDHLNMIGCSVLPGGDTTAKTSWLVLLGKAFISDFSSSNWCGVTSMASAAHTHSAHLRVWLRARLREKTGSDSSPSVVLRGLTSLAMPGRSHHGRHSSKQGFFLRSARRFRWFQFSVTAWNHLTAH